MQTYFSLAQARVRPPSLSPQAPSLGIRSLVVVIYVKIQFSIREAHARFFPLNLRSSLKLRFHRDRPWEIRLERKNKGRSNDYEVGSQFILIIWVGLDVGPFAHDIS